MTKLPLTIVTAVMDEEKLLPAFLGHVRDFADEIIVVVDYRSADKSEAIARKKKCVVLKDRGQSGGIVFNNKNWGARVAKNDWVLILDVDERMDHTLQREIRAIIKGRYPRKADIYQTSFINYEFGKFFDQSDQKKKPFVRLFKKGHFSYHTGKTAEGFGIQTGSLGSGKWYGQFLLKIPKIRTWYLNKIRGIVTLKGHLVHLSHPTIIDFIRKINHYSTRESRILFDKNPEISNTMLVLRMVLSPLKEFLMKFFVWKLYKEGLHGFIAANIYAFYYFLINAKYFRQVYRKKNLKSIEAIGIKYDFKDL